MNTKLEALITTLTAARDTAMMIKAEYEANGSDSLANIDFGALLNTDMLAARELFNQLDESGMFTAGWQPDDWMLVDTSIESEA